MNGRPASGAGFYAPPGFDPSKMDMAAMMQLAQAQNPMFANRQMTPEQIANVQEAMSQMQAAMSHPLSRAETAATFEELAALGVTTPTLNGEMQDCLRLAPPSSDAQIGMMGSMMQNMILPKLKDARAKMAGLSPEEQNQLASGIVDALKVSTPHDRKSFLDGFGAGFFPEVVVQKVRAAVK